MKMRCVAHFFMASILKKLHTEYYTEYWENSVKKYKNPKIYPKIVLSKPLSAFSKKEKKEIMLKYKRWYIYYEFMNEEGVFVRQPSIYFNLNQQYKEFDDRLKHFKISLKIIERLLKEGFSPYESEENPAEYTIKNALYFVLELKKLTLKPVSYKDYETRTNEFITYLSKKGLDRKAVSTFEKKYVNDFLNHLLRKSSPRNRNNSRSVLSSLFSQMVVESFIQHNYIKDGIPILKTKPQKNTAFTEKEVKSILDYLKETDIWLYYFCLHVYYGLFRNVEIVRITIKDINLTDKLIKSNTKTGNYFKQIPQILIDEFYSKIDLTTYPKKYNLFTKYDKPSVWKTKETNKRGYFGKRFTKVVKNKFNLSVNHNIYSFRHSAIGKIFLVKIEEYKSQKIPNFEEKALNFVRTITNHKDNNVVRNYLREIGYYKIDDWSDIFKN